MPKERREIRLTFRTFTEYRDKLVLVAEARGLRFGKKLNLGAALNHMIDSYDCSADRKQLKKRLKRKTAGGDDGER